MARAALAPWLEGPGEGERVAISGEGRLAVSPQQTQALVLALLAWRWQRLLTASLNEELAMAAGIDPRLLASGGGTA